MKTVNVLLLLLTGIFFCHCKSAKITNAPKPNESYSHMTDTPPLSTISIPVSISVDDMNKTINNSLPYVLYDDNSFSGDNLMVRVTRSNKRIELNMSGNTLKYNVPVRMWIKQNLLVGSAEAEGELNLGMRTTYQINSDWTLRTQTSVDYHEWLQKPVLRTGFGNVNIESLANIAVNQSKSYITREIDKYVSERFSFRQYVEEAWNALQAPILLDPTYQMWVKTTPQTIGMTPIQADFRAMQAKIGVECINEVTFGEKPAFRQNANLPNLTFLPENTPDEFSARIIADVPFPEAERLAKQFVLGQEFTSGKYKVKVDDLKIWGNNDKLVVNTLLSGSFNGNIYFTGKPVYNKEKNQIEVSDLDFHLDTKNFLHQSAAWMFSGPIKNQMRKAMAFPLTENIEFAKQMAQQTLSHYEIQPGIVLTGNINDISVNDTKVTPQGILVYILTTGTVRVDVKGL